MVSLNPNTLYGGVTPSKNAKRVARKEQQRQKCRARPEATGFIEKPKRSARGNASPETARSFPSINQAKNKSKYDDKMKGKVTPSKRNDEPRKWYEKTKQPKANKEDAPAPAPMKKNKTKKVKHGNIPTPTRLKMGVQGGDCSGEEDGGKENKARLNKVLVTPAPKSGGKRKPSASTPFSPVRSPAIDAAAAYESKEEEKQEEPAVHEAEGKCEEAQAQQDWDQNYDAEGNWLGEEWNGEQKHEEEHGHQHHQQDWDQNYDAEGNWLGEEWNGEQYNNNGYEAPGQQQEWDQNYDAEGNWLGQEEWNVEQKYEEGGYAPASQNQGYAHGYQQHHKTPARRHAGAAPPVSPVKSPEEGDTARRIKTMFQSDRSPAATIKKFQQSRKFRPKTPARASEEVSSDDSFSNEENRHSNNNRGGMGRGKTPPAASKASLRAREGRFVRRGRNSKAGPERPAKDTNDGDTYDSAYAMVFSRARHGRIEEVRNALEGGMPVDSRDPHGNTLLLIACQNGQKRIVKLCLRYSAKLNATNRSGNTALHFCFMYAYYNLGDYLISKGCDDSLLNFAHQTCYDAAETGPSGH